MTSKLGSSLPPKPTLKQQFSLLSLYNFQTATLEQSQWSYLSSFKLRLQKQISKQQAQSLSNNKILKNLYTQIKQFTQPASSRTLAQIQKQRVQVMQQINQIKRDIKLLNTKHGEKRQEGKNQNQNMDYEYQIELKKNTQYKKKIEELDRSNEQMKVLVLPSVRESQSRSGEKLRNRVKNKKQLELIQSLSVAKSKAQKGEQVYLGNISSKQGKMMELEKSSQDLDRSLREIEQEIEQMKLIGL